MQTQYVNVKTNAHELSRGEVIAKQDKAGYVQGEWVIVEDASRWGTVWMTMLCAPTKHHHEWLSHCCSGKSFSDRDQAVAYINSLPGISN